MPRAQEFWTAEQISRLEQALAQHQDDVSATAFLARLSQCHTVEQKRSLIVNEFLPAMRTETTTKLWEGQEIATRLALRDIIQDFLYRVRIAENIPTNEPDTPDEQVERERLARLFGGGGEPASEMVTEDRGSRCWERTFLIRPPS